jgi:hypothetical protein
MKIIILTLFSIVVVTHLRAQNFEFSIGANTGLFHYTGNGSVANSYIAGGAPGGAPNHTYNPYGNKNGLSYGAYAQLQYVTKCGFIIGSQFGYDVLRSKVNITGILPFEYLLDEYPGPAYYNQYPANATGHAYLQQDLFNLNPYIGYRIKAGKINVDLMPGIEFGFDINSYDKGKATFTDPSNESPSTYTTDYNLGKAQRDIRAKFGAAADYRKWALMLSYARGYTSYLPYLYNASSGDYVHTRLLRVGVSYRIK